MLREASTDCSSRSVLQQEEGGVLMEGSQLGVKRQSQSSKGVLNGAQPLLLDCTEKQNLLHHRASQPLGIGRGNGTLNIRVQ